LRGQRTGHNLGLIFFVLQSFLDGDLLITLSTFIAVILVLCQDQTLFLCAAYPIGVAFLKDIFDTQFGRLRQG
jgi:hypothetical protein